MGRKKRIQDPVKQSLASKRFRLRNKWDAATPPGSTLTPEERKWLMANGGPREEETRVSGAEDPLNGSGQVNSAPTIEQGSAPDDGDGAMPVIDFSAPEPAGDAAQERAEPGPKGDARPGAKKATEDEQASAESQAAFYLGIALAFSRVLRRGHAIMKEGVLEELLPADFVLADEPLEQLMTNAIVPATFRTLVRYGPAMTQETADNLTVIGASIYCGGGALLVRREQKRRKEAANRPTSAPAASPPPNPPAPPKAAPGASQSAPPHVSPMRAPVRAGG